ATPLSKSYPAKNLMTQQQLAIVAACHALSKFHLYLGDGTTVLPGGLPSWRFLPLQVCPVSSGQMGHLSPVQRLVPQWRCQIPALTGQSK
ncbi:hypothetical protein, partial [Pseudomonas poae]|uniref:hypothetical protein n=1 Tax=Pseudomonas poae TaxID=200451 RepID=UPI0034D9E020